LVRVAKVSGFLTVLGAVIIFVITNFSACRKALWWRDNLNVLGFKSNEYLLAGNDGDGPVYVSHVSLVMDLAPFGKKLANKRLNVLVPQDMITSIPIDPDFDGKTKYVGSPTAEVWKIALQRTFQGDSNCFWPVVFAATDHSFLIVKDAYAGESQVLRTFPAWATVRYYSLHTKQLHESNVPAIGVIIFRDVPECTMAPLRPDLGPPPDFNEQLSFVIFFWWLPPLPALIIILSAFPPRCHSHVGGLQGSK
jgi:hypothetical protein